MRDGESWFDNPGGHRTGLFRSVDLNVVGWAAVVGPGVVVGLAAALMTSWPWWVTMPVGVLGAWTLAVVLDAIAWRRVTIGIGASDLTPSQLATVLDRLNEQGVDVSLREDVDAETGEAWLSLQSTNRFSNVIRRELDAERRRPADDV